MNASLAAENGDDGSNVLSERDPTHVHFTRRQLALALVVAIVAALAAIYTVHAVAAGTKTFPAVVTTSKVYDLNFANTAKITGINVRVGERIKAGQMLATQDASLLKLQRAADEQTVNADQQVLKQTGAPQLTTSQSEQDALQVQEAQTSLTNAQVNLKSVTTAGQASVAEAQAAVTSDQALLASDTTVYSQNCPNGPIDGPFPPNPTPNGMTQQQAQAQYVRCQNLQTAVQQDTAALNKAQAQVPAAQAQAQEAINSAQASLSSAQGALNNAQAQATLQGSPSGSTAQAQAQANLNQADAQLAQVEQEVNQATLVAPDAGVVSAVYGIVGENLGPNGVHVYSAPSGSSGAQSSGFSLFPQPSSSSSSSGSAGVEEPFIELVGGRQQVRAQIPQSDVSRFQLGHSTKVFVSALGVTQTGTVSQVGLSASNNSGTVSYAVIITLDRTVPGLSPGMTAAVTA